MQTNRKYNYFKLATYLATLLLFSYVCTACIRQDMGIYFRGSAVDIDYSKSNVCREKNRPELPKSAVAIYSKLMLICNTKALTEQTFSKIREGNRLNRRSFRITTRIVNHNNNY